MRKMKYLTLTIFFLLMNLSFIYASNNPSMHDKANLLTSVEISQLEYQAKELEDKYNIAIYMVTTNDLEGKEPKLYAIYWNSYFSGYYGDNRDSILVLIDTISYKSHILVEYKISHFFTDKLVEIVQSEMDNYLAKKDYKNAFSVFINDASSFVSGYNSASDNDSVDASNDSDEQDSDFNKIAKKVIIVLAFSPLIFCIAWVFAKILTNSKAQMNKTVEIKSGKILKIKVNKQEDSTPPFDK